MALAEELKPVTLKGRQIPKDEILKEMNKPKKETNPNSYKAFKKKMIRSYGLERWTVIESFLWTEPKEKIDKALNNNFGTLFYLMGSIEENPDWWQDDLEGKS